MANKNKLLNVTIFLLLSLIAINVTASRTDIAAEQPSPTLGLLQDFAGMDRELEDYTGKGKWVVVMLWASSCEVSNRHVSEYNSFYKNTDIDNLEFVGVSVDGLRHKANAVKFIQKHSLEFPNLIGEPSAVPAFYAVLTGQWNFSTPSFLIFAPNGDLMAQQTGAIPPEIIADYIKSSS